MSAGRSRGGMCRSPFGLRLVEGVSVSNRRLDKIEVITAVLRGDTPPEYAIFAEILLKAIHNYWYWGLGNNGCTDVKWLDAYEYLFKTRSSDQQTWGDREQHYTEDTDDGKRIKHVDVLTDEDMRLRCFDVHYNLLNMDQIFPLSSFLRMIEQKRTSILTENREQVEAYMESQREREFCRMPAGSHMMFSYKEHDFIKTLSRPDNIRQLEELVMFPLPRVRAARVPAPRKACRTWRRPDAMHERTMNGRTLVEEINVGHTDHNPGRADRGVSPLQAA